MSKKNKITTELLEDVINNNISDKISIKDLIVSMKAGGFGLIILLSSLPIIVPLPPPIPSLISIPLIVFSFQMIIGLEYPILPKFLSKIMIKRTILAILVEKSNQFLRKIEKLMKPRMLFLSKGIFERLIGLFILIFSLSILFPFPLTNFLPGIGILIIALGLLSRDGIIILLGIAIGIMGIITAIIAITLGIEAINIVKEIILDYINLIKK